MATIVGSLLVKLSAITADFDAGLNKSSQHAKGWASDIAKIGIGNIGTNIATSALSSITNYVKEAVKYVIRLAEEMDNVSDASEKLGISLHSRIWYLRM